MTPRAPSTTWGVTPEFHFQIFTFFQFQLWNFESEVLGVIALELLPNCSESALENLVEPETAICVNPSLIRIQWVRQRGQLVLHINFATINSINWLTALPFTAIWCKLATSYKIEINKFIFDCGSGGVGGLGVGEGGQRGWFHLFKFE